MNLNVSTRYPFREYWWLWLLLFLFLLNDAHLLYELLLLQLQKLLFALIIDFFTFTIFNLNEVMDALHLVEFAFIHSSPLHNFLESLAHVFELEMCTSLRASVLVIWIIIKVNALVVHQVVCRVLICKVNLKSLTLLRFSFLL